MTMIRHYKDLIVWKKAMELVTEVYRVSGTFPSDERFGLIAQIRKAVISIPSNIAEGQARMTTGKFRQFLGHARGSLMEVETQILVAQNLAMTKVSSLGKVNSLITEVGKLLNGLISSLPLQSSPGPRKQRTPASSH